MVNLFSKKDKKNIKNEGFSKVVEKFLP